MYGAVIGDIVGSRFERHDHKSKEFQFFHPHCRYTDDSVLTIATFDALSICQGDYARLSEVAVDRFLFYGRRYRHAGYGKAFYLWLMDEEQKPYNSWGNGAAMRVSPCAWFARSLEEMKELSYKVTSVTHNNPEGLN